MIDLTKEQLKNVQNIELEILIEIDRICTKNRIHYSLTGGTLLGAVRHKGFIPWDDDADISMLRSEYIKFQKACEKDLDTSRFYFQDIENTFGYRWGYGKIRRKDSLFLRENQEDMPYEQGIFVDVFPRDSMPDNIILRMIHTFACFCVRKMMYSAVGRKASSSRLLRKWYAILYFFTKDNIVDIYKQLLSFSKYRKSYYVRALTFPLPKGVAGYKREWYRKYKRIEFEGHQFQVEAGYIDWLKNEFGDYLKLPPVEKRKTHPVTDIRFPN